MKTKTIKSNLKKTRTSVLSLYRAAEKFGVRILPVTTDKHVAVFSRNGKNIFVIDHVPDINSYIPAKISKDKVLSKKVLKKENIPVPEGIKESNLKKAIDLVRRGILKYPLVVKPVDGSMGQAVTVDIQDENWLIKGIEEVYKFNRRTKGKPESFLIESYVSGDDYRFLVLDGKVLTVLMRKPAYVVGDGQANIMSLISRYNSLPNVGKTMPLCPIVSDAEMMRHLKSQGLSDTSVPPKGKKVSLRKNANVSTGGRSFECMSKVHPAYLKLAIRVSKLFGLRFCAVDLIAPDIRKFEKYYIIEINDTPGFDVHEHPYSGKPFPVAEHLIRALFFSKQASEERQPA